MSISLLKTKTNLTAITFTLFLIQILIQTANAAPFGRLEDPNDPKNLDKARLRCGGMPLTLDKCERALADGVSSGCITQEEAKKLKEWGMAPVCFYGSYSGWCSCGCFDPSTFISIDGPQAAQAGEIANNYQNYSIKHLNENSMIGAFETDFSGVLFSTSGAEAKPLVVIETKDGRILKLTTQHAVMTGQGDMITAKQITPETLLLDESGKLVEIRALGTETFTGHVVNFRLNVQKPIEHVIFAQGLAVGDQAWQSTLEDLQNQILIRQ